MFYDDLGSEQAANPGTTRAGALLSYDRLDYQAAWELQRQLVQERIANRRPDTLILLEHGPVFTIGRSAKENHWRGDERALRGLGYPVYRVERGGSVTYHGPGQIVGYPILRLNQFCAGPKAYMHLLEEVVIRTLADWGIVGRRIEKLPGVWVGSDPVEKIAAMGVRIIEGTTMHGFALNVSVDLTPFTLILPCGIPGCRVTSMAARLAKPVDHTAVRDRLMGVFGEVFGLTWINSITASAVDAEAAEPVVQGGGCSIVMRRSS
ncbi:MAG: lipoyl(octanoyl) transferase LipB [Nitrospirales bacterium]